jgi:hypothetical protein
MSQNELLSAYIDGELTAEERAQVEQLLSTDPAARQLFDELRALSSTLKSLPQETLGEDLSEIVLRMAERRILTTPAESEQLAELAAPPQPSRLRRIFSPRALAWSSLAIAVAVLFMVVNPDQGHRQAPEEVALVSEDAAQPAPESDIRAAGESVEDLDSRLVSSAVPTDASGSARIVGKGAHGRTPVAAEAIVRNKTGLIASKGDVAPKRPPVEAALPTTPATSPALPESPPAGAATEGLAAKATGDHSFKEKTARSQALPATKGGSSGAPFGAEAAGVPSERPSVGHLAGQLADEDWAEQVASQAQLQPGYAIVQCDVSPHAFRKQALDQVLGANNIVVTGSQTVVGPVDSELSTAKAHEPDGELSLSRQQDAERKQATTAQKVDLVYVEATPAQIEATLAGLATQKNDFRLVSVKPASGVEAQRRWLRYDHRARRRPEPPADDLAQTGQPSSSSFADTARTPGATEADSDGTERDGGSFAKTADNMPQGRATRLQLDTFDASVVADQLQTGLGGIGGGYGGGFGDQLAQQHAAKTHTPPGFPTRAPEPAPTPPQLSTPVASGPEQPAPARLSQPTPSAEAADERVKRLARQAREKAAKEAEALEQAKLNESLAAEQQVAPSGEPLADGETAETRRGGTTAQAKTDRPVQQPQTEMGSERSDRQVVNAHLLDKKRQLPATYRVLFILRELPPDTVPATDR